MVTGIGSRLSRDPDKEENRWMVFKTWLLAHTGNLWLQLLQSLSYICFYKNNSNEDLVIYTTQYVSYISAGDSIQE